MKRRGKRSFVSDWKTNRPWLRVEVKPDGALMFCDFCIKASIAPEKTNFVKGCSILRLESIKLHESNNSHLFAVQKHVNEQTPSEAPAVKAKLSMNKKILDRLTILFRTVHAINIQARSSTDYCWLTDLDEVKGLNVGMSYRNHVQARGFASAIADIPRREIRVNLEQSKYAGVIVDGSTDSSTTESEMIFIQTSKAGFVRTNFVRCCQGQRGDAKGIVQAIKKAIETLIPWNEFVEKLVAMGSDGASVMLGKNNGVIALLQSEQPSMIGVHCSGHRLELAYKDAVKKCPLAEKVTTLLKALYIFYSKSSLNRANLKNAYRCLGMKLLLPTRADGTRWVGHVLKALHNFLTGYAAFRLHLEQLASSNERSDAKSKAIGFLKLIKSREVIMMALHMQDILTILHKVSLKFQEEGSVVCDVSLCIKTASNRIRSLVDQDGPFLKTISQFEECSAPSAGTTTRNTYRLTGGDGLPQGERAKFTNRLCDALNVRFEDTRHGLIQATSIANFKTWPVSEMNLGSFGDEEIGILLDQFKHFLPEVEVIKSEWPLLRSGIYELFSTQMETLTWHQVNRRFRSEYPRILDLFDVILTIPATSTACERGFSHMKLIKSEKRSSMKEESLSNSLMIKLEGPSIKEFDPLPAIELWFNKAHRRPGTSHSKENKVEATVSAADLEEIDVEEENGNKEKINEEPVPEMNNAANAAPIYELVQQPDDDSDFGSEYESANEDDDKVFDRLAYY